MVSMVSERARPTDVRKLKVCLALCGLVLASLPVRAAAPPPLFDSSGAEQTEGRSLANASEVEQKTVERLLGAASWPRRAIAMMWLERYDDVTSALHLAARVG